MVRAAGADDLADRLERALDKAVKLLALTIDERAIIQASSVSSVPKEERPCPG